MTEAVKPCIDLHMYRRRTRRAGKMSIDIKVDGRVIGVVREVDEPERLHLLICDMVAAYMRASLDASIDSR